MRKRRRCCQWLGKEEVGKFLKKKGGLANGGIQIVQFLNGC